MTLHYITLHCITLHYITLYCITLNYITLYDITWSKILYYLRLPQPKNQIHNAIQGWWVDGLMGWWVNEFMDSWVDGYWFLVVVPEYWFPGIGSRVSYPVTQNAGTIHSSPRKPCQNEEIQVWHKKCTECIQMIVFHDSFGEPSKPPNHASNDPKYYTTSDWLSPEIKLIMPYRETTVFWKPP